MSNLTRYDLDKIRQGLEVEAQITLRSANPDQPGRLSAAELAAFCQEIKTPNETSRTHILRPMGVSVKEWNDRRARGMRIPPKKITVENQPYTTEVEEVNVRAKSIERIIGDQASRVAEHSQAIVNDRRRRLIDMLNSAFTTRTYDGQYMASASHSWGNSGIQSNLNTSAYSKTQLKNELVTFMNRLGTDGYSLGLFPNILLVTPANYFQALEDVNSAEIRDTTANTRYGTANAMEKIIQVRWDPDLDPDNWGLFSTGGASRIIVVQEEQAPRFDIDESLLFDHNTLQYSMSKIEGMGLKHWELGTWSTGGS